MGDVCVNIRIFKSDRKLLSTTALALAVTIGLSACQTSEVFHNGYVVDQAALDLYDRLLEENDQDLYPWVSGTQPCPPEYLELLSVIAAFAKARHGTA